jgi:hypothetical protein
LNEPGSLRSIQAIARINYLHGRYRKKGKISDDDMLYTLSLFALEPMRWIKKYEWRELTDVERCACAVLWKTMGDALNVNDGAISRNVNSWINGLEWMEELDKWSTRYEEQYMKPAKTNGRVADATIYHMTHPLPQSLKPFGHRLVAMLLTDRLRTAML